MSMNHAWRLLANLICKEDESTFWETLKKIEDLHKHVRHTKSNSKYLMKSYKGKSHDKYKKRTTNTLPVCKLSRANMNLSFNIHNKNEKEASGLIEVSEAIEHDAAETKDEVPNILGESTSEQNIDIVGEFFSKTNK